MLLSTILIEQYRRQACGKYGHKDEKESLPGGVAFRIRMPCSRKRGFAMERKKRKHTGRQLRLPVPVPVLVLAVLLAAATPVMETSASSMPGAGTLTIHKYAMEDMDEVASPGDGTQAVSLPADASPLSGVEFSVWEVNQAMVSSGMTPAQAWQDVISTTKQTGTTAVDGTVRFNLGSGVYYVAETGNGGNESIILSEPFLVSVPMRDASGSGWITDVHAYPKNQSLVIDKFVGDAGGADYDFADYAASKKRPVAVGETFGWSIVSALPANLSKAAGETYTVTDELSGCFDYVAGSVKVYAAPAMNTPVAGAYLLSEGTDYTLNFNSAANTLTVQLSPTGITLLGGRYTSNGDRCLLIKYDCRLNQTAAQGVGLYSGATLSYAMDVTTASSGTGTVTTAVTTTKAVTTTAMGSSAGAGVIKTTATGTTRTTATARVAVEPEVHTGQIGITKLIDGTTNALAGARFGLAVSKEAAKAGNFIATGTTDASGRLMFQGLQYGIPGDGPSENTGGTTYWLAETKAPAGYKQLTEPTELTFQYAKDGNTGEYYFAQSTVYNVAVSAKTTGSTTTAAKTGDTSMPYLLLGTFLLSLSVIIVLVSYHRRKRISGQHSRTRS